MGIKKEIRNFLDEYFMGRIDKPCNRKIYLTDKDYLEVEIVKNFFKRLIIRLHIDNYQYSIFCAEGLIDDLDGVWRKLRYRFKRRIAREEKLGWDAEFVAKLKELYSLL